MNLYAKSYTLTSEEKLLWYFYADCPTLITESPRRGVCPGNSYSCKISVVSGNNCWCGCLPVRLWTAWRTAWLLGSCSHVRPARASWCLRAMHTTATATSPPGPSVSLRPGRPTARIGSPPRLVCLDVPKMSDLTCGFSSCPGYSGFLVKSKRVWLG